MADSFVSDPNKVIGNRWAADASDFGDDIAFNDHKIAYVLRYAAGKDVLDLGCVDHNTENYRSRYWLHKALKAKAHSVVGMDLSEEGAKHLTARGFDVVNGDAQKFDLGRKFDLVVAGDLIEHLEDFAGFIKSCKAHLKPGGSIIISTPNPWYWRNIAKAILTKEVDNNPEHTCWLDPRTLRQLAARHDLELHDVAFGSRYARDLLMPLPRGIKHTSWHGRLSAA